MQHVTAAGPVLGTFPGTLPSTRDATSRVRGLTAAMTLPEKAAQMTQAAWGSITPEQVAELGIGSVLSGGGGNPGDGSPSAWRDHVGRYVAASRTSRLGIPILYGTDAVHGHNNVRGATIFPHQIGLGATADAALVARIGRASALETLATGARWTFAPCLAVPFDVRWGRTYEGFSQDHELVAELGAASIEGWAGPSPAVDGVVSCAKHYVGEGAMAWGSAGRHRHDWIEWWDGWGSGWQIDQGDIPVGEDELRRVHLPPFAAAVRAGVPTVMACYASWQGTRIHAHRRLLTDVLKHELGFAGFVVSDWMAVDQLDADHRRAVESAIAAGVDMVMVPFEYERFIGDVVGLVETGRLPIERIDDAVTRILTVKAAFGLLDGPDEPVLPSLDVVGSEPHRRLARAAVAASVVPLVGGDRLPIAPDANVLTAGEAIDDIGLACGGWTVRWEGGTGDITPGRTVLDGLREHLADRVAHAADGRFDRRAAVGIVSVHETPYVEGGGDRADLSIPDEQLDVVRRLRDAVDHLVVLVVSGRPLVIEPIVEIADTVLAGWLPGSEAAGIADVIVGAAPLTGRLPVTWPRTATQVAQQPPAPGEPMPWPIGHHAGPRSASERGDE